MRGSVAKKGKRWYAVVELLQLLATRYGYWDHDAEHDDPFAIA